MRNEKIKLAHEEADRIRRERKRKQSSNFIDDNWGREPELTLNPQYPRNEDKGMGANAWSSELEQQNDNPKKSNQDRLKDEFGDRVE